MMTPAELTVLEQRVMGTGDVPTYADLAALFAALRAAWKDNEYWTAVSNAEYAGREAFREGKPRENPTGIEEWEEGWDAASDKADAERFRRIERERIEVRHHDMIHVGRGEEDSMACAPDLRAALAKLPEEANP